MRKNILLVVLAVTYALCFAKGAVKKDSVVSGRDFYFVSLAYKEISSQQRPTFKQDKEHINEYIRYLEILKEKYTVPIPKAELRKLSREERRDYFALEEYLSVSEEDFKDKGFLDINEYKFDILYGEKNVEVYMYIDNPSVRDGDVKYVFDYDGNLISRQLGG